MKRICKTFRLFVYICVGVLFSTCVIATVFNLGVPFVLSVALKNKLWLLLYIVEPILLFLDIYLFNLLDDLEWWI